MDKITQEEFDEGAKLHPEKIKEKQEKELKEREFKR